MLRIFGEIHGSLSRRIRAPDDVDFFTFARQGFRRSSAVVDSGPLQAVDSGRVKLAPLHSAGDHEGVAGNLAVIRQLDDAVGAFQTHADDFLWRENFDSEALRLDDGPAREIVAA